MDAKRPYHPRIFLRSSTRSINWTNPAENRRRRLLAEFLHRKSTKNQEIELENMIHQVTLLPDDLLFKIFILLPAESLNRLQFVCKKWFGLINSSIFIRFHAPQSETVLVHQKPILSPFPIEGNPKFYLHFMNLDREEHNFVESSAINSIDIIIASYDGLVLAITEEKSLIFMNPVTRKHMKLPLGKSTLDFHSEFYSIAFCNNEKTYKLVHLFRDLKGGYGCEILSIGTQKWRIVEGPCSELLTNIKQMPVSFNGSLYYMPRKHGCDYYVTMNVTDEKFVFKKLPMVRAGSDRLIEIEGKLGFATYAVDDLIVMMEVWILMGSCEKWEKRHVISLNVDFGFPIPICCSRNGKEMVIASRVRHLNVYSFENGEIKQVYYSEDDSGGQLNLEKIYIPHRNTLATWEDDFILS